MPSYCILTDNSVQYPQPSFIGRELVRSISYSLSLHGTQYASTREIKPTALPAHADDELAPCLIPPSVEDFLISFQELIHEYDHTFVLLASSKITSAFQNATEALQQLNCGNRILLIDTLTISAGLGILVQQAADFAARGLPLAEVERSIRQQIGHIYTLLYTPGLSYLYFSGFLDRAQAWTGELLGLFPIYAFEDGSLTPLQKVRNQRNVIDYFQEFIEEFDDLQNIALVQSIQQTNADSRILRQFVDENFSDTSFSELTISIPSAVLFGPRTIGLVVSERV